MDNSVLIEIIRRAIPCEHISIGLSSQKQTQDFLSYPIPWYSYIEALTGLDRQRDVQPAYLFLVMWANNELFKGQLIPQPEN